ncbi:hypothetical protein HY379_02480 [Candidatus Saccharibacteria bacterium]|nr:hypothetical protein [Candidatus Saccharibacteria bacterium]
MRRLAIISVGIVAILGTPVALALRGDDSSGTENDGPRVQQSSPAGDVKNESSVSVETDSSSSNSGGSANSSTTLNVNGVDINVPQNGEVHRELQSGGQTTVVDVESSNSSTASGQRNSQTTNLHVFSRSSVHSSSITNN